MCCAQLSGSDGIVHGFYSFMHGEAADVLASAPWLVWCGRGTGGKPLAADSWMG